MSLAPAPPSPTRVVPQHFLLGWVLLAAGEALAPPGAPAVPLCLAVAAGLLLGGEVGFWSGLVVGLAADLLTGLPLGAQALPAALMGAAVGALALSVSPSSWTAPILFLGLGTVPYRFLVRFLAGLGSRVGTVEVAGGLAESARMGAWDVGLGLLLFLLIGRVSAGRRPA